MATLPNFSNSNPPVAETLHDVWMPQGRRVGDNFVNPGTPDSALVTRNQMAQATIAGARTDILRASMIKG